jgi:TolA-binding protein
VDAELAAHLEVCAECSRELAAMREDADLIRDLPWDRPDRERIEQLRTRILSESTRSEPQRRSKWVFAALAAGLGIGIVAASLVRGDRAPTPARPSPLTRAAIDSEAGAHFARLSPCPDEVIELHEGAISVQVEPLSAGERFRVVTRDAEIEVRGTVFEARAALDRLTGVHVTSGRVEVRQGSSTVILNAGDRWSAPPLEPEVARAGPPPAEAPRGPSPAPKTAPRAALADPPARLATAVEPSRLPEAAPGPDELAFREGFRALDQGDYSAAARAFERSLSVDPNGRVSEDSRYWLGVALAKAKDDQGAARALAGFLDRHPGSPHAEEATVMLGWILYGRGDYEAAKARFSAGASSGSKRVRESAEKGLQAIEDR